MTNDELRALAEAATPGPWRSVWAPGAMTKAGEHTVQAGHNWVGIGLATQDAAYIAAASPERIIALLDELESLKWLSYSHAGLRVAARQIDAYAGECAEPDVQSLGSVAVPVRLLQALRKALAVTS